MVELIRFPIYSRMALVTVAREVIRIWIGEINVVWKIQAGCQFEISITFLAVVVATAAQCWRVGIDTVDMAGGTFQFTMGVCQLKIFVFDGSSQERNGYCPDLWGEFVLNNIRESQFPGIVIQIGQQQLLVGIIERKRHNFSLQKVVAETLLPFSLLFGWQISQSLLHHLKRALVNIDQTLQD